MIGGYSATGIFDHARLAADLASLRGQCSQKTAKAADRVSDSSEAIADGLTPDGVFSSLFSILLSLRVATSRTTGGQLPDTSPTRS